VHDPLDFNTTVHMTEDRNISALFSLKNYQLNLFASSGGAINQSGSTTHGSYLSIYAIPDNGYSFWGWTGDGITDPFSESTSVLMTSDRNVTAHFTINMNSFLNPSKIEGSWFESWLGIFNQVSESWIYHLNLGWLLLKIEDSNLWIWHETNGWLWTTEDTFENRHIWSQPLGSWIFLQFNSLEDSLYYNYLTQSWVEW
jgi:uncharacterized repeat protein (TIGR02543 family)